MTEGKGRRRVLIVEDEPALRLSYERHFKPRYDLIFASTGAEALVDVRDLESRLGAAHRHRVPAARSPRQRALKVLVRRRKSAISRLAGNSPSGRR